MLSEELYRQYQDLQAYVEWNSADVERVRIAGQVVEPHVVALIDDFYAELVKHPAANQVIRGGAAQIERLKGSLRTWLRGLFQDDYGVDYVNRRWRVGLRHVEIGLDQTYTNVALSRLRSGLLRALKSSWSNDHDELLDVLLSLNKLLDLDLAIIELAYQTEFQRRQQQVERLATIGQVAGGVAHEIRNPLNVIKTSVYFLLHAKNPSAEKVAEKVATHLGRIERQVGVADDVVTTLNNFARMAAPELKPVDLRELLNEVLEINPLGEQIVPQITVPDALPAVLGDAQQLRIVFGNLIRNARDAMPTGGALTIDTRRDASMVEIAVTDSGAGIRAEDIGKVMEPLYSTKARGIGLGLAISRAIVEKHNGQLSVASELGKGSTFFVRLASAEVATRRQGIE
jgi:two-component system, NtrC family, sensor kinase